MAKSADVAKEDRVFYCKNSQHDKWVWTDIEYLFDENGIAHAVCPICGESAPEVRRRFLTLKKMWDSCSGPRDTRLSRLSAYKTGEFATQPTLMAPALYGKFLECENCEFDEECSQKKLNYCPVQVEPMLRFLEAYESGRVTDLRDLAAMSQASLYNVFRMCIQQIYKKGVMSEKAIRETKNPSTGEKITYIEWQANPLLHRIPEIMQQLGFSAVEQMMTTKTEREDANIKGFINAETNTRTELKEHTRKVEKSLKNLNLQIQQAQFMRSQDDALKRHNEQLAHEQKDDKNGSDKTGK